MVYLIAACVLMLGTLLVYGLRPQSQRRALMARDEPGESPEGGGEARR